MCRACCVSRKQCASRSWQIDKWAVFTNVSIHSVHKCIHHPVHECVHSFCSRMCPPPCSRLSTTLFTNVPTTLFTNVSTTLFTNVSTTLFTNVSTHSVHECVHPLRRFGKWPVGRIEWLSTSHAKTYASDTMAPYKAHRVATTAAPAVKGKSMEAVLLVASTSRCKARVKKIWSFVFGFEENSRWFRFQLVRGCV
jgi:hypothetical protein